MNAGDEPLSPTRTGLHAAIDYPPGTVLAERFRIDSLLGIGGMGVVYRATDLALGVPVAIKLLRAELASRPEAFERFRQELLLARQVSSPHVVRIHDIARHGERWLISMDLVEGEGLDRVLDRRGALPPDEALGIARDLAEGLAAAHACGIVHRDLKPSNVLIDAEGRARIADFGVARSLGGSGFTQTGAIVGTPDYLSPEQARGERIDGRSDLYALGLLLHEMLTGQPAFAGATPTESMTRRMLHTPPPVDRLRPGLPSWVARLVTRLLQPRPAHRFADARAVIQAIDARRVPRDFRPGRRSVLALGALAVLAVMAWALLRVTPSLPVQPPDRLLVWAEPTDAEIQPAWSAAVEHLRLGLAELPALAVVDGERTQQAAVQLGLPRAGRDGADALAALVPSRQQLQLRLEMSDAGYRIAGEWHAGSRMRRIEGDAAASLLAATQDFGHRLGQIQMPPATFAAAMLPAQDATLAGFGRALELRRAGRPAQALPELRATLETTPAYAVAWLELADAALQTGHWAEAGQAVHMALQQAAWPGLAAHSAAVAQLVLDDPPDGIAALEARLAERPDDLASSLRLAQLLGENGEHAAAIKRLQSLVERDGDDPRAWFLLGKYAILSGDARRAVDEYLLRALVLYKRGRHPFGEAESANALGIGYARLGQSSDAAEQYQHALRLRRSLEDRRGIAASLRNLAQLATFRGELEPAAALLEEARGHAEALEDRAGLAAIERELGLIAEERGDYAAALEAYRRSLRQRELGGDAHGAAENAVDIGFVQYQRGDYDSAQAFWRQAAEAYARLEDPRGEVRAAQNLGLLAIVRGRWDESRRLLEDSLQRAERLQLAEEAAVSRRNLAELEIVQGHVDRALLQIERAEALFREREDRRGLLDAGLLRARAHLVAADRAGAAAILAALSGELAEAGLEQQALGAILLHQTGVGAAADADALAARAGVRAVQLWARLHGGDAQAVAAEAEALGHAPLQFAALEQVMRDALNTGSPRSALAAYAQAADLLRARADFAAAFRLHALGAGAASALGDAAGSAAANQAARAALARLRQTLPATLQATLDADPQVRELEASRHDG
jgi:eukaryotic-like serine/threonine-protein kinase